MRAALVGLLAYVGPGLALSQEMVGDPAAGEAYFNAHCGGCHVVENAAGEVLAGDGTIGVNLYGLPGRAPGSVPDFTYSDMLVAHGETGAVWEEADFVAFLPDPSGFLQEATGMSGFSRMGSGTSDPQTLHDLWAYLASVSSPAEGSE